MIPGSNTFKKYRNFSIQLIVAGIIINAGYTGAQSISINASTVEDTISPFLYGTGFESFCDEINLGLWADMIADKSLEWDKDFNGIADRWSAIGTGDNTAFYAHDSLNAFNTDYSQKISITSYTSGYRGIAQEGLYIETGKTYALGLFLRQDGLEGDVTVSLAGEYGTYAQVVFDSISQEWTKYSAILTSTATVTNARLQITFAEEGTLWIDQVTLMPGDNYRGHGTRRDIMEKLVKTRPTIVRWPGGMIGDQYNWEDGIGDRDKRPTRTMYVSTVRVKQNPEIDPNQFGTDEFMQFLEDIGGAEPILAVNCGFEVDDPLPQKYITSAANWVEYCNGDTTTPYGALRAANGHPEPYNVKYWNLGSSQAPALGIPAEVYANRVIQFAIAMKEKDPSIQLIMEDGDTQQYRLKLLRIAGSYIDFYSIHRFYNNNYINTVSYPNYIEGLFKYVKGVIDKEVPGNDIRISFNEWNTDASVVDGRISGWTLREGIIVAGMYNALERQAKIVAHSGLWPLFRSEDSYRRIDWLWKHNLIHYDNHRLFTSVPYLALDLYRSNFAPNRLPIDVVSDEFSTPLASDVPYLDAVATKNDAGDRLIIKVVNKDTDNDKITSISLTGNPAPTIDSIATVYQINSADISDMNTLNNPNAVVIDSFTISYAATDFQFTFPAHSVTVIKLSGLFPSINTAVTGDDNISLPTRLTLRQNYPNPFNSRTVIRYSVPVAEDVLLEIYDITGRKVRTLLNGKQSQGFKSVLWDGRDDKGVTVPTGLYFSRLTDGESATLIKMMLIK
ncbi:MAG: T9SS type A sorting domain-containing protein [FCB group bacterium]|nr:T9SS type A sorting domain-containing protein [FCB group bacterium]